MARPDPCVHDGRGLLERHKGDDVSIHLVDMPDTPMAWRNDALAEKWSTMRQVRRAVTGALEVERTNKVIGASLEAAPTVYVSQDVAAVLETVSFDDLCITSSITVSTESAPADAFKLDDVADVAVVFDRAEGEKCLRCWKILPDVGTHAHAGTCQRCNEALS
jgi:isoleucyl-tRNA synthetase